MSVTSWLTHPVTLVLAGLGLLLLLCVLEILLRSLAEIGNVRFQGTLEDHPGLFRIGSEGTLHVSVMLDALRWLQMANLALLWIVILMVSSDYRTYACLLCLLLPILVILLVRALIGGLGEKAVVRLLRLVRPLLWPVLLAIHRSGFAASVPPAEDEEEEASEREIQAFVDVGQAAGLFERDEGEIVESLVDFFDTTVREVMTPRTDMVALPATADSDELLRVFIGTQKSRVPIYSETIDKIVGVVHVKNLVKHMIEDEHPVLSDLAHDCIVVPESKELGDLLKDFQNQRQQMAIVVDEYGGTSGLVTLEDILEEIVGDIVDEHEPEEPPDCQQLSPGLFQLLGRADVEVLEDLFQIEVNEEGVETVGGLVFARHGTVPEAGTEVLDEAHGLLFTVEEMDGNRIVSVKVQRTKTGTDPGVTGND
jgi:CBS domain containing-hemolysin-like protein